MENANQSNRLDEEKLLRIRAETELPSHKVAASLDDLDRDILEMHQNDVFFSYVELAERWDVTVATNRNRIKLETGAHPDNVVSTLLPIPVVTNVVIVAGRYDFFLHYVRQNKEEYRQFVAEQLRKILGIANVESFIGIDLYERKFELGVIR